MGQGSGRVEPREGVGAKIHKTLMLDPNLSLAQLALHKLLGVVPAISLDLL